jgi:hypothetical protein
MIHAIWTIVRPERTERAVEVYMFVHADWLSQRHERVAAALHFPAHLDSPRLRDDLLGSVRRQVQAFIAMMRDVATNPPPPEASRA